MLTLKQMAEDLSVPFAETDGFMTIGGMSKGDVVTFTQKADELVFPFRQPQKWYIVQAGFFEKEGNANAFHVELSKKGVESAIVPGDSGFRVQVRARLPKKKTHKHWCSSLPQRRTKLC